MKNEEPRQSTPQSTRHIKSTEYIYADENDNLCGGLRVHPEFEDLIYPLAHEELLDLEASLQAKGCLDPIKVWQGYIIDGYHRYRICEEKNIPYDVLDMDFEDEWEVKKWMIDNQLGRRNLTDIARIEYASLRVDIVRGVAQRNQEENHFTKEKDMSKLDSNTRRFFERKAEKHKVLVSAAVGSIAGVSASTVKRYNYVKQHADPETLKALQQGKLVPFGKKGKKKKLSVDGLYRELKSKEKNNAQHCGSIDPRPKDNLNSVATEQAKVSISSKDLRCGSPDLIVKDNLNDDGSEIKEQKHGTHLVADMAQELKSELLNASPKKIFKRVITHPIDELHRFVDSDSVDVIITEPPCKEEDIELFDHLGDFVRHALKDGGVCMVICGNRFLPDFIEMLRAHLDYVWTVSLDSSAVKYESPSGHINKLWKPALVFSKGTPQMKTFSDVKNDVENIMHTFTGGGDVVCDPFCNYGQIAKFCVENGRSIIASDMDVEKTDALKKLLL